MASILSHIGDFLLCRSSSKNGSETTKPISLKRLSKFSTTGDLLAFFIGCFCSAAGGTLQNMVLVFGGWITTVYMLHGKPNDQELITGIKHLLIYLVVCGVIQLIVTFIENICLSLYSENLVRRIRKEYVAAVLRQDSIWWESTEPGAVTIQLNDNVDTIKDGLGNKVGMLIRGFSMYVSSVLVCMVINWRLTLIFVPIGPLTAMTLGLSEKVHAKYSDKQNELEEKAASTLEEVLLNVKTVQLCNAQEHFVKKYRDQLFEGLSSILKSSTLLGFIEALALMESAFMMAVFLWASLTMYFTTNVISAPGDILLIINVLLVSSYCLSLLGPHMSAITKARITATGICETIDRPSPFDITSICPVKGLDGRISFTNVRFKYHTRKEEILKGLSWNAEPGQSIALVGESGCGKSTSLHLLTRMYEASAGSIEIDGMPLNDICPQSLRRLIGVVEQRSCLFSGTIADNIRFGREKITDEDIEEAAKMANAHEFIKRMTNGYDTLVGDGAMMLSGGQKQRIAIARAIVTNPKILLLDEATSALDTQSEKIVQEALNKASKGRTTVIVAHRLSTLKDVDRIFVLESGQVVESGTHNELIAEGGLYSRLAKAQDVNVDEEHEEEEKKTIDIHSVIRGASIRRSRKSIRKSMVREELPGITTEEATNSEAGFSLLLRNMKGNYMKTFLSVLCALLRGTDLPLISLSFYYAFVSLQHTADNYKPYLYYAILVAVGSGILSLVSHTIMSLMASWSSENVFNSLKAQAVRSLLYRPIAYFDKQPASTCVVTIIQQAPQCKAALDMTMGMNIGGIMSIVGGILLAVFFVWPISVLGTICCILLYIITFANLHFSNLAQQQKCQEDQSAQLALEVIENVKTVQTYAVEDHFVERYSEELKTARTLERKIAFIDAVNMSLTQSFVFFSDFALYFLATYLVYYGYYDVDIVFLAFLGAQVSSWAVIFTAPYFPDIIKAGASIKVLFEYIDDEKKIEKDLKEGTTPEIDGDVSFEKVNFAYPTRSEVLVTRNLNLNANKNEKIALVGPSGGGKSTVLNLLTKIYAPSSGSVKLGKSEVGDINTQYLRRHVAVVGQEPVLFRGSILENITMGDDEITVEMVKKACETANAMKFIDGFPEKFDMDVGEGGKRLSGGQRQRIAIARAIVRKPKILLLDEATAALDAESEELVNKALASATQGTTSITIAHRLKTVQQCDRIYVVESGKVVESGTHRELMDHDGNYAALVKAQKLTE